MYSRQPSVEDAHAQLEDPQQQCVKAPAEELCL